MVGSYELTISKRTTGLSSTEKVEIPSHRDGTKSLKPERVREKTGLELRVVFLLWESGLGEV